MLVVVAQRDGGQRRQTIARHDAEPCLVAVKRIPQRGAQEEGIGVVTRAGRGAGKFDGGLRGRANAPTNSARSTPRRAPPASAAGRAGRTAAPRPPSE